jgi:diguanylate cyclase (GGDEF)-like protein
MQSAMLQPRTALVVDSDRAFAAKLEKLMVPLGVRVEIVHDGVAAIARIAKGGLDIVVTELSLPKIDGFRVIEELRKHATPAVTGAVAVSHFASLRTEASERKEALGIAAVIAKNGPLEAAMRALRRTLPAPLDARDNAALAPQEPPQVRAQRVTQAEASRLAAILDSGLMDEAAPPDDELQRLVADVAREFGVSTALITFVLEGKQWFKAYSGISGAFLADRGSPRDVSFCKHVVEADRPRPLIVPDAAVHPAFMKNPHVVDGSVRSYAGAPLVTSAGHVLGTLCLIDTAPSRLDVAAIDRLSLLARRVAGYLELQAQANRDRRLVTQLRGQVTQLEGERARVAHVAERLASVLDHLEEAVLLIAGDDRHVVFANDAAARAFGKPRDALIGLARDALVAHVATLADDAVELRRALAVPERGPYAGQAEIVLAVPKRRVLRWSAKPIVVDGAAAQMSTFVDITAEHDLAEAREREAHVDQLTGLLNRRGLDAALERELARRERAAAHGAGPMSFVLFDIDHFKRVNDQHGHGVGDVVRASVANVLRETFRGSDLVARWGGEEMLAVLPDVDENGARFAAERARTALRAAAATMPVAVTVSAGVSLLEGDDVQAALKRADERLYRAKAEGRDRVV